MKTGFSNTFVVILILLVVGGIIAHSLNLFEKDETKLISPTQVDSIIVRKNGKSIQLSTPLQNSLIIFLNRLVPTKEKPEEPWQSSAFESITVNMSNGSTIVVRPEGKIGNYILYSVPKSGSQSFYIEREQGEILKIVESAKESPLF